MSGDTAVMREIDQDKVRDADASSSPSPTFFSTGDCVRVVKMPKRKQHYNGLIGIIHQHDPTTQKYTIRHNASDNPDFLSNETATTQQHVRQHQHGESPPSPLKSNNQYFWSRLSAKFLVPHSQEMSSKQNQPSKSEDKTERNKRITHNEEEVNPSRTNAVAFNVSAESSTTYDADEAIVADSTGWKTVNRQKKGFGRTQPGQWVVNNGSSYRYHTEVISDKNIHTNKSNGDGGNTDDRPSDDEIYAAIDLCRRNLRTTLYWKNWTETDIFKSWKLKKELCDEAEDDDGDSSNRHSRDGLKTIVCYGIGNFGGCNRFVTKRSHSSPSLWQLALALIIQEECIDSLGHRRPSLLFFDPVMTKQEQRVLETLGIEIIQDNEMARRTVQIDGVTTSGRTAEIVAAKSGQTTLFFMPFCPMLLYCNVLLANWDWNRLQHVVIFGNQLDMYIDDHDDGRSDSELDTLRLLKPLWKSMKMSLFRQDLDQFHNHYQEAFSNSALHWFPLKNDGTNGQGGELELPERPDLDYVSSKVEDRPC